MKNTLSYLAFSFIASTSSLAFGVAVESPCNLIDCPDGQVCELADTPCACPVPADGQEPEPCVCEPVAVCVAPPAPPCDSDSDCTGEDVCVTYTFGTCSGSTGAAPRCDDPDDPNCQSSDPIDPIPEECVEESENLCVPKFAAPCSDASDCGAGFTCETPEICTCTAGQPVCDTNDPNCSDLPGDDDCSCEPSSGDAYCQIIPTECTSDMDCETGFTCLSEPTPDPINTEAPCEQGTNCNGKIAAPIAYCIPDGYREWVEEGGTTKAGGRKVDSAKRKGFFGGSNGENATGEKADGGCQVSQSPVGFAGGSLLLFGLMFGFRRKEK